jgi:LAO/AO transport system kinase
MSLAEKIIKGDVQAAARLITLLEDDALNIGEGLSTREGLVQNEVPQAEREMESLYSHTGKAYIVGVTGAPGVGKSTLTDSLIGYFRKKKMTTDTYASVGVIAIDPTSALTGGALLGDRIRMQRHAADPDVFIRSLATRGWTGGLAKAALGAVHVMNAMGKDIILIETVGSGQVELDIVKAADTTLLVLSPGAGDEIQTMKAGIIESAEVFAINKADKEGADRLKLDLEMMLSLKPGQPGGWAPPIVLTEAINDKGTEELGEALLKHREYLIASDGLPGKRRERAELELLEIVEADLKTMIRTIDNGRFLKMLVDGLQKGRNSPRSAAHEIMDRLMNREG